MNRRNEDFKKERESFLTPCCEVAKLAKEKSLCNSAGLDAREVEGGGRSGEGLRIPKAIPSTGKQSA